MKTEFLTMMENKIKNKGVLTEDEKRLISYVINNKLYILCTTY